MREEAVKEAACKPRLVAEYIDKWVPDRPSDAHCISELELDRGFSSDAAKSFLRIFDETVRFAKLDEEALNGSEHVDEAFTDDGETSNQSDSSRRIIDDRNPPPTPRGPRPLPERLKVAMDGRSLAVTATLENEAEVEQLIAMLTATKVLLPKTPAPAPIPQPSTSTTVGGPGAVDLD